MLSIYYAIFYSHLQYGLGVLCTVYNLLKKIKYLTK